MSFVSAIYCLFIFRQTQQQIINTQMSRATPFSPQRHHKRVERLYFPKYDDPSLHLEYGRKHFAQKVSFPTPYACIIDDSQYIRQSKQKSINAEDLRQRRESSFNQRVQTENYSYEEPQGDRRSFQYQPIEANQALEQQIHNFNQHKEFVKDRETENLIKIRPQRMQTEAIYDKEPIGVSVKMPSQLDRYTDTRHGQTRLKTQQNRPTPIPRRARFNPTFLSSLNY